MTILLQENILSIVESSIISLHNQKKHICTILANMTYFVGSHFKHLEAVYKILSSILEIPKSKVYKIISSILEIPKSNARSTRSHCDTLMGFKIPIVSLKMNGINY